MRASYLCGAWTGALVLMVLGAPSAGAQRRSAPDEEVPAVVPWLGVDFGLAVPAARCETCDLWYGGPAFAGSIGTGITLRSGLSIGAEETGMMVVLADSPNSAGLRLLTVRAPPVAHTVLKVGAGTGWYRLGGERLVDDRPTGLIGLGFERGERVVLTTFVNAFASTAGADQTYNSQRVHYRLRGVQGGSSIRIPLSF